MIDDVQDLIGRQKKLADSRRLWESHWQDLAEVMLPRRADFSRHSVGGEKRTENQFDGAPMQAARALAAAVDALIKPKGQRWFALRLEDDALERRDDVKIWLKRAEDRLYGALYDPRARFLQRSAEVDLDLVVFGTGVLFVGERIGEGRFLFRSHHLSGTYIAENADGDVDTVFRVFSLTARQAAQRWGRDRIGAKTREALEKSEPDREFPFLHVVCPREERWPGRRDRVHMPFASVFIDIDSAHKIGEGGYAEFPFIIPRWDVATDELYGRSPGMLALPDARTLQQIGKTLLKAGHKAVDPPLLIPDDGIKAAPRTWPGGLTYYDASALSRTGGRPPIVPLETGANIPLGREMQNDIRDQVWRAFFRDVLNLPAEGPRMTATEVMLRREEYARTVGPTLGRLEADYCAPIINRCFRILLRNGAFPPPPRMLGGAGVRFEYVSPLARTLRQIEVAALRKTVEEIAPVVQADPKVLDNFNADRIVREVAEANGLPQTWLRGDQSISQIRATREEAAAAEKQADDLERAAEAGAKLAQAAAKATPRRAGAEAETPFARFDR